MGSQDDYVRHAEECQRLASTRKSEADIASWLQLADGWMRLAAWRDRHVALTAEVEATAAEQQDPTVTPL